MANNDSVHIPGGAGGMQGIKPHSGDPLDVNGSSVKTGDISRTRLTGGLGHYTLHTKSPSSGHKFRDDQGSKGKTGGGTSKTDQHWA